MKSNNIPGELVLDPSCAFEPAKKVLNTLCFGAALSNSDCLGWESLTYTYLNQFTDRKLE